MSIFAGSTFHNAKIKEMRLPSSFVFNLKKIIRTQLKTTFISCCCIPGSGDCSCWCCRCGKIGCCWFMFRKINVIFCRCACCLCCCLRRPSCWIRSCCCLSRIVIPISISSNSIYNRVEKAKLKENLIIKIKQSGNSEIELEKKLSFNSKFHKKKKGNESL